MIIAWIILFLSCRKTCRGINYDILEAVCCDNQLHQGAGLACCGKQPFNPLAATCCKIENGQTLTGNDHTFLWKSIEMVMLVLWYYRKEMLNLGKSVGTEKYIKIIIMLLVAATMLLHRHHHQVCADSSL